MMAKAAVFLVFAAASIVTPVVAEPVDISVTATGLASVEAAARLSPRDGGALIELANAYYRSGRVQDARTAYQRALVTDNAMMELPLGDAIWSHEVARVMLAKDPVLSSR